MGFFEHDRYNKKKHNEDDFYYSNDGYIIFTEKYHLNRGYCCKSNCKHCPYGYDIKTGKIKLMAEFKTLILEGIPKQLPELKKDLFT